MQNLPTFDEFINHQNLLESDESWKEADSIFMGPNRPVTITLNKKHTLLLQSLPESGMGYQLVDIKLNNGTILKNIIVYDSNSIVLPMSKSFDTSDIEDINLSINNK